MHLKTQCNAVGNVGSMADQFKVGEITKAIDAESGSDAGSDNVDIVVGVEVEGTVINYVTDVRKN